METPICLAFSTAGGCQEAQPAGTQLSSFFSPDLEIFTIDNFSKGKNRLSCFFFLIFLGLPQNHKTTHGSWYDKKTIGEQLLLERKRMYPRLQYDVHKLLHLQQTGGRCCRNGSGFGKIVPYEGELNLFISFPFLFCFNTSSIKVFPSNNNKTFSKKKKKKVAQMPKEEVELDPPVPKGPKGKKAVVRVPGGPGVAVGPPVVGPGRGRPSSSVAAAVSSSVPNSLTPSATSAGTTGIIPMPPLGTQAPSSVPGSTNTTTIAPPANIGVAPMATHNSLPQQVVPPTSGYHAQPAIETPAPPAAPPPPPVPTAPTVMPPQQPAKLKKGVKRKADTTTPTANSFEPLYHPPLDSKNAKISTRRESGRQIKKVSVCAAINFLSLFIFISL